MKKVVTSFAIFSAIYVNGQNIATDSKGRGVFTYYSHAAARFDISSDEFEAAFSEKPKTTNFVPVENKLGAINVVKKRAKFIKASILNAEEKINLSDLENFRPGFKVTGGKQWIVDSISVNFHGRTFGYGWNAFGSFDNLKIYNPGNSTVSKQYPLKFGIAGNITFFPREKFNWILWAFTANLSRGWDETGLLNYKESGNTTQDTKIVAFEEFDGKYGKLNFNVTKFRVSASAPISIWYLNPIPYIQLELSDNSDAIYYAGVYMNVISKRINFRNYKQPSSFGVGLEWYNQSGNWSSAQVFIRGSVSIGDFD